MSFSRQFVPFMSKIDLKYSGNYSCYRKINFSATSCTVSPICRRKFKSLFIYTYSLFTYFLFLCSCYGIFVRFFTSKMDLFRCIITIYYSIRSLMMCRGEGDERKYYYLYIYYLLNYLYALVLNFNEKLKCWVDNMFSKYHFGYNVPKTTDAQLV